MFLTGKISIDSCKLQKNLEVYTNALQQSNFMTKADRWYFLVYTPFSTIMDGQMYKVGSIQLINTLEAILTDFTVLRESANN